MKQTLLVIIIGLGLWGCSVNDSKESEDANSSSSSSRVYLPDTEFRTLNVVVDYLQDSAWVDTFSTYYGLNSSPSLILDTIVLEEHRGDTLRFNVVSYGGWGKWYSGTSSLECYISEGRCNQGGGVTNSAPAVILHIPVGNANSSTLLWGLASSDSAVIWNESLGGSPNPDFVSIQRDLSYIDVYHTPGPHMSQVAHGYEVSIRPISRPTTNGRSWLPSDSTKIFVMADYNRDSLWVRDCSGTTDDLRDQTIDTIKLLNVYRDSIVLLRKHYSGTTKEKNPAEIPLVFISIDTITNSLTEAIALRATSGVVLPDSYPLMVMTSLNGMVQSSTLKQLASQDSVLIWSDSWGFDSLYSERIIATQYLPAPAMEKTTIQFMENGFQVTDYGIPYPFVQYWLKACTVRAIRNESSP